MTTFRLAQLMLVGLSLGLALSSRAAAQVDPYGLDQEMQDANASIQNLHSEAAEMQSRSEPEVRAAEPAVRALTNEEKLQNLLQQKKDADYWFWSYQQQAVQLDGDEEVLRQMRYYQGLSFKLAEQIRQLRAAMNPAPIWTTSGVNPSGSYSVRSSDQTATTSVQPSPKVQAPSLNKPNFDGR